MLEPQAECPLEGPVEGQPAGTYNGRSGASFHDNTGLAPNGPKSLVNKPSEDVRDRISRTVILPTRCASSKRKIIKWTFP